MTITNGGSDATGVSLADNPTDPLSPKGANGTFKIGPTAANYGYAGATGNIQFNITAPLGLLSNSFLGSPAGTISAFDATSAHGGTVSVAADGSFNYTSDASYTGTSDSFTYTISNGVGPARTGTVTIGLTSRVIFVSATGAGTTCRSATPCSLATADGLATISTNFDLVYVLSGTYNNATFSMNLLNQRLVGQGVNLAQALTDAGIILDARSTNLGTPASSIPIFNNSTSSIVTLAPGSLVEDLSINPSGPANTGAAITGTNILSGTATIRDLSVTATGTANAVTLSNNTGGTFNFSNVALTAASGFGLSATGGGTVNATQNNTTTVNTITTTTGTALNVANTNIGASGLTFRSISANGGSNGIILNNTGASSGLTVTGAAGSTTNDGSGGTIQHETGAEGSPVENATVGVGVYLNSTKSPSLNHMNLHDFSNYAVVGTTVNGFTMTYSTVSGTNGTGANAHGGAGEGDVYFTGLSGSATVDNSTFNGAAYDSFHVFNNSNQTLNRFTRANSTLGATDTAGNDGLVFQATGGTLNVTVQDSSFTGERGDAFQMDLHGTMTSDLVFGGVGHGNTLTNAMGSANSLGGDVNFGGGNVGDNVTSTFNISNNSINGAIQSAISVGLGTGNHTTTGTINANTVGTAAVANSGSFGGSAVAVTHSGGTRHTTVTITNNILRQYNNEGVNLTLGAFGTATGFMTATVTGNTMSNPGSFASQGFLLTAGTAGTPNPQDTGAACLTLTGNTLAGVGANGVTDIRIRDRFDVKVGLPGYGGATTDGAAAQTFLSGNNGGASASIPNPSLGTTNGTTNGFFGSCPAGSFPQPADEAANSNAYSLGASNAEIALAQPAVNDFGDRIAEIALAEPVENVLGTDLAQTEFIATPRQSTTEDKPSLIAELYDKMTASIEPTVEAQSGPASGSVTTSPTFTLPAGASVTITYQLSVANGPYANHLDNLTDAATVSGSNFSTVTATPAATIPLDASPSISVANTDASTETQPGATITYAVSATNANIVNGQDATGVRADGDRSGQHDVQRWCEYCRLDVSAKWQRRLDVYQPGRCTDSQRHTSV